MAAPPSRISEKPRPAGRNVAPAWRRHASARPALGRRKRRARLGHWTGLRSGPGALSSRMDESVAAGRHGTDRMNETELTAVRTLVRRGQCVPAIIVRSLLERL